MVVCRLVTNRHFELAVFLVIVYSCSLMVLADPNKVSAAVCPDNSNCVA